MELLPFSLTQATGVQNARVEFNCHFLLQFSAKTSQHPLRGWLDKPLRQLLNEALFESKESQAESNSYQSSRVTVNVEDWKQTKQKVTKTKHS